MIMRLSPAVAVLALLVAGCQKEEASPAPSTQSGPAVPAPAQGWTETVAATPEGGFVMGNPNAPVKLVEFASLTCPHCAEFAKEAYPALKANYVASGKVSLEIRNYVRDAADIGASLISRCGGPGPYFKLTEQIFATQEEWFSRLQALPKERQAELDALPQPRQPGWIADAAGLTDFARQRGIPSAKLSACLSDAKALDALVAMRDDATTKYSLSGTPTFLINGESIGSLNWPALEAKIREALG